MIMDPSEDIHVQLSIKNNAIIKFSPTVYFQINDRVILETTERLLYRIFNSKAKQ
jgi:hypothetical protein